MVNMHNSKNTEDLKRGKKVIIALICIVVLALVFGVVIFLSTKNNPDSGDIKKLKDEFSATKQAETVPSSLDPSILTEINQFIVQQKYIEAKTKLDSLATQKNLTKSDEKLINATYANVCLKLNDFDCIARVVEFNEKENTVDVYLLIDAGRKQVQAGKIEESKQLYAKALDYINANGGEKFINQQGTDTDNTLSLEEIQKGAGR